MKITRAWSDEEFAHKSPAKVTPSVGALDHDRLTRKEGDALPVDGKLIPVSHGRVVSGAGPPVTWNAVVE